jgi:hypothetical protein
MRHLTNQSEKNNYQAVSLSNQDGLNQQSFWNVPASELLEQLRTIPKGLTDEEAGKRLTKYGANLLRPKKDQTRSRSC